MLRKMDGVRTVTRKNLHRFNESAPLELGHISCANESVYMYEFCTIVVDPVFGSLSIVDL